MASTASRPMSVSTRPTDEPSSTVTSEDAERGGGNRGAPLASQLEETREGAFADKPTTPVNLAQTMSYAAGDVIANKYRLTKILGEGGMGAVWLARNLALEIDVAIKLIRHDYANAEGAMRLLQEARAAARIGHPCIVRVFDFGTTERSDPFIVMEVLQGESLGQTIKRKGKLSAISAVRTLLPVAGALAAAHSKGIVHRDLKPDNIRLVTDDRGAVIPKVVDFGIAKLHHDDIPRETTQAGVILGSPHYMSPEQACGRSDVDHRTDVWAFSVMLYEVITGKRPFEGANYNALISSILVFHPASWEEHDLQEPELWALVQKGLAKEPQDRWFSMQEYGEALAIWASKRDVETDAAGNSLRAHWLDGVTQRPLSEFPPGNGGLSEGGRPRMVSDHNIRMRMPSIPELALPDIIQPTPPPTENSPEPEEEEDVEDSTPPSADDAPPTDDPSIVPAPPTAPSSSLPLPTTASKPPERRRSAAVWIGPLALAVGAAAAALIMSTTKNEARTTELPPASSLAVGVQDVDKPVVSMPVLPTSSASAAPEVTAVVPVASVIESAVASSSANAPPAATSARSNVPVSTIKTSSKIKTTSSASTAPPPIPTEAPF